MAVELQLLRQRQDRAVIPLGRSGQDDQLGVGELGHSVLPGQGRRDAAGGGHSRSLYRTNPVLSAIMEWRSLANREQKMIGRRERH